jgi:flavorubredoxin
MGAEELEEDEFRPFFDDLMKSISNQRLFLFGSYGWGGGEWMRNWESEIKETGKNLGSTGLISNGDESEIDESEYQTFINAIKA